MKSIICAVVSLALIGCAAGGQRYSESSFTKKPGKSEIYIFRQNKFVAGGSCYQVGLDGTPIGVLGNAGFLRVEAEPGSHEVSVPVTPSQQLDLKVSAKPDEAIYIQFNVGLNSSKGVPEEHVLLDSSSYKDSHAALMNFHNLLVQVSPDYAVRELQSLKDSAKTSCMGTLKLGPEESKVLYPDLE